MRLVSVLLSLLMVSVATVVVASNINVTSHAATTQGSRYYNEVLGFDIDTFTTNLEAHKQQYFNTPYSWSYVWTVEPNQYSGVGKGMSCTTFVAFALNREAGVSHDVWYDYMPFGERVNWVEPYTDYPGPYFAPRSDLFVEWAEDHDVKRTYYNSIEEMLADHKVKKGDIVLATSAADFKNSADGDNHAMIAWPSDTDYDRCIHCAPLSNPAGFEEGSYNSVMISDYAMKQGQSKKVVVFHGSESNVPWTIEKVSSDPTVTIGNPNYSLAGAQFTLTGGGQTINITIGSNGTASVTLKPNTTYTLTETVPPKGFALAAPITFTTGTTAGSTIVSDTPKGGEVQVTKKDATDGSVVKVAGFEFTLYKDGSPIKTSLTDSSGVATFTDVPFGNYTIKETDTVPPYRLSDQTLSVTVSESVETASVEIEDDQIPGELTLIKTDRDTGRAIAGAVFDLVSVDGVVINGKTKLSPGETVASNLKTDSNGKITVSDLPIAQNGSTYKFVEKSVPVPYAFVDDEWSCTLTVDSPTQSVAVETVSATNVPATGRGKILKSDEETGRILAGAVFDVIAAENIVVNGQTIHSTGDVVETVTTGTDGTATTSQLNIGDDGDGRYQFVEKQAPTGYHLDSTPIPFTITYVNDRTPVVATVECSKTDKPIRGGLEIEKVDLIVEQTSEDGDTRGVVQGDADSFDGVEFELTNVSGYEVMVGGTVYQNGAVVKTIPLADGTTDDVLTIKDGYAATTNTALPYGVYEIREVESSVPAGYLHVDTVWRVDIVTQDKMHKPTGDEIDGKISNDVIMGGIIVPKVDAGLDDYSDEESAREDNNAQGNGSLAGAEFAIKTISTNPVVVGGEFYSNGDRITTIPQQGGGVDDVITTDANGVAQTAESCLPYGTYVVTEVKAPNGYHLSTDSWTVEVRENGVMVRAKDEERIEDEIIRGGVQMPKVDAMLESAGYDKDKLVGQATGDATLDGAEFAIINKSDHHVIVGGSLYDSEERITTIPDGNNDGKTADVIVTVGGIAKTTNDALPYGTYEIYEVTSPDGYEISTDRYVFDVTEEGVIVNPKDGEGNDAVVSDVPSSWKPEGEKADGELMRNGDNDAEQPETGDGSESDEAGEDTPQDPAEPMADDADNADGDVNDGVVITDPAVSINGVGLDKNPDTNAQGDATLEGATFHLINRSSNMVVIGGEIYQPGERIMTIPLPDGTYGEVVTSDATGTIAFGDEGLPYGTYELGEQTAPEGYNLSDDTYIIEIRGESSGTAIDPDDYVDAPVATGDGVIGVEKAEDAIEDEVVKGGLSVQKVDKETGRGDSIVNGNVNDESADDEGSDEVRPSLAGTMFEIRNASEKAVLVDGKLYQVGQVVKTITTDANGYAATEPNALPYGTYDVYEVDAPLGYLSSSDSYGNSDGVDDDSEKTYVQTVKIRKGGVIVPCARPFANQVKRGDIAFTKIDDDGSPMSHVAFKVTSKTTGESHVIVTDENGAYDSSSAVIPHSQNTNANDDAFDADGNIDDDKLVYDAGTWFYGNADGKPFAGDGTLPNNVDRFGLPEELLDAETDDGDGTAADGSNATDDATNADDSDETTDDSVNDDGTDEEGVIALALGDDVENGSGSSAGSVSEPVHVNPVYEVIDESGASKQVTIGYVETDANGSFTNNSVVFNADGSITIVYDTTIVDSATSDTRSYTSYETYAEGSWKVLVIGSDAIDGESESGCVDADGNGEYDIVDNPEAYTASSQYPMNVPDDRLGAFPYGEYLFEELPSEATYGRNLVAFEATIERHNYLLNLGPITDNIIDIHTTATDQVDGDKILTTDEKVTIVDTVEYTNLNTDREYTMTGTLMDYETGEPMKDADGNVITSSVTFKPSTPNGSVDVIFEIDASQLGGVQTVVFEDLYWNNIHIASHADIEDDGQRVEFHPEIGTTAVSEGTNDHFAYADGSVIIVDTVHYKGVVPGREFIVHGILMDKNTGDALVDSNGETVENSVVFTPETSEGDVEVRFEFDATDLAGLDVVVFENLYRIDTITNRVPGENDDDIDDEVTTRQRLVASHADINDEGQTVSIRANGLASDQIASDLVQTGAMVGGGVLGVAVAGMGVAYVIRKLRRNR